MKVKLTVKQRIHLLNILPDKGNITMIKMLRVLREALSFDEKENKVLSLKQHTNGMVTWDPKSEKKSGKEINIPDTILEKVRQTLEQLNVSESLSDEHLELFEMFVSDTLPKESQ